VVGRWVLVGVELSWYEWGGGGGRVWIRDVCVWGIGCGGEVDRRGVRRWFVGDGSWDNGLGDGDDGS